MIAMRITSFCCCFVVLATGLGLVAGDILSVPPGKVIKPVSVYGSLAFSPDGKWLILSGSNPVTYVGQTTLFEPGTWVEHPPVDVQKFEASTPFDVPVAWASDSKTALVGMYGSSSGGAFMVVAAPDWRLVNSWRSPAGTQQFLQICTIPRGTLFIGNDRSSAQLRVQDYKTGRTVFTIPTPSRDHKSVSVSPNGRLLAISDGRTLRIVNLGSKTQVDKADAPGPIIALTFSPDSARIAVVFRSVGIYNHRGPGSEWLQILRTSTLSSARGPRLVFGSTAFRDLAFSSDGRRVFVLIDVASRVGGGASPRSFSSSVLGFDSATLESQERLGPIGAEACGLAVSPDGKYLVTSDPIELSIWSVYRNE